MNDIRFDEWDSINDAWLNGECRVFIWPPADYAKRPIVRCQKLDSGNSEYYAQVFTSWPTVPERLCVESFAAWDKFRVFWRGVDY